MAKELFKFTVTTATLVDTELSKLECPLIKKCKVTCITKGVGDDPIVDAQVVLGKLVVRCLSYNEKI